MALTKRYVSSSGTGTWADSTSSGTPTDLATAITNAAGGDHVLIDDDGTYTLAGDAVWNGAGTDTNPLIVEGYNGTEGNGYQGRNDNGTIITTNMPLIDCDAGRFISSAPYQFFRNLQLIRDAAANVVTDTDGATGSQFVNCKIEQQNTSNSSPIAQARSTYSGYTGCEIRGPAGGSASHGFQQATFAGYCNCVGCLITVPGGTGAEAGTGIRIVNCLIYDCDYGIEVNGANADRGCIYGNTIVDIDTDGILFDNQNIDHLMKVIGNLITDVGGYCVNDTYATVNPKLFVYNRFDRHTSGATSGIGDWPLLCHNSTSTAQADEYEDFTNKDFRIKASSPAANAMPNNRNIGYYQFPAA